MIRRPPRSPLFPSTALSQPHLEGPAHSRWRQCGGGDGRWQGWGGGLHQCEPGGDRYGERLADRRSEEGRVGEEGRYRGAAYHLKKNKRGRRTTPQTETARRGGETRPL